MPEVRVGPLLRHVGETDATIWVETDTPCAVEVLGHRADTFEVEGHNAGTKIWQIVCSGLRKEPSAIERVVLRLGHTGFVEAVGKALVRTTKVGMPRLRWRPVTVPHFRNQIGTLEIAGGEMGVRIEAVTGNWRKPRLTTVIEHKLL